MNYKNYSDYFTCFIDAFTLHLANFLVDPRFPKDSKVNVLLHGKTYTNSKLLNILKLQSIC